MGALACSTRRLSSDRSAPRLLLALLALLLSAAPRSLAANSFSTSRGIAVVGQDRALLEPPAGVVIEAYKAVGYELRLRADGTAEVTTDATVLATKAPFALPQLRAGDRQTAQAALARALATGAKQRYQAVSRVLAWVSSNIRYELERTLPQDAASVLARRSGYCTGVARLTVALLDELGIEAREVPGFIVESTPGASRGFHRWVEVYYPDLGWVMSDPLVSHHVVPATYLRLASEAVRPDSSSAGRIIWREDEIWAVDVAPGVPPGIRVRRNDDRQLAGALRVMVGAAGRVTGMAVLEGKGVRLTHVLLDGGSTFLGLEPGSYTLSLELSGGQSLVRAIELPGRVRQALLVPFGAAGSEVPRTEAWGGR